MASIDKAFIKAYSRDDSRPATVPAPKDSPRVPVMVEPAAKPKEVMPAPHAPFKVLVEPAEIAPSSQLTAWRVDSRHLGPAVQSTAPIPLTRTLSSIALDRAEAPSILPLSAYAPQVAAPPALRPAFEVDRFVWPAAVDKLLQQDGEGFAAMAKQLIATARDTGHNVIGITGVRRGIGQSSLLLALARALTAEKASAAVVDADFQSAQLARQLGLAVRIGFDDVLAGEQQLVDVLVESLEDNLTLLPLNERLYDGIELGDKYRLPSALGTLGDHYDVTLVDAGPLTQLDTPRIHCFVPDSGLTAMLLIRDLRHDTEQDLAAAQARLAAIGIPCLGLVENFAR